MIIFAVVLSALIGAGFLGTKTYESRDDIKQVSKSVVAHFDPGHADGVCMAGVLPQECRR